MWLALDTATQRASVALGVPGRERTEESIIGARRHAAELLPAVQRLLQRAGASLGQLEGIVLSDGPGSFTGLRVGAAFAKALVKAQGMPLWTAPSLMVRAAGVALGAELVVAVSDALRGEVYVAGYRFFPARVETALPASVRRADELAASALRPAVLVGDAPDELVPVLNRWAARTVLGSAEAFPRAGQLIDLVGKENGARQVGSVDDWEPVYGRPAEAQARWESAHGRRLPDSVGRAG